MKELWPLEYNKLFYGETLEVKVKDSVKDGASTNSGVSDASKVDYCVVYLQLSTAVRLLLLEAKTDRTLTA